MDHYVIFGNEKCGRIPKVLAAAKMCGVSTSIKPGNTLPRETMLFPRFPTLCTPTGFVEGSNGALRYLAAAYPTKELYGTTMTEKIQIDSLLEGITAEIEVPLCALRKGGDAEKIGSDIMSALTHLNGVLACKNFVAGHRMSIADISLAFAVKAACESKVCPGVGKLVHVVRICNTVYGRSEVEYRIEAEAVKAEAAAPQESKKKEEKRGPMPSPADGSPTVTAMPKVRDPIEDLPETEFDMEAWKRKYSNSKDLKGDAMPYLWEKLDTAGWSFWHFKYQRYNDQDNTKVFMASNMLGMFLQRIDNWLRKYMFGVCEVFEQEGYFDIEGVMMLRGLEIPVRLRDHDQYESFVWTKLDLNKDKQLITDYFCEEDSVQGKKIADCKVYK